MANEYEATNSRLSRIETLWSVVQRAHNTDVDSSVNAQQQLLELYGGAIRRYLLAAVRDPDLADELFQEFAVKFVQGDFRTVDPSKGKFRSFVKTVLYRMVALHHRKKKTRKEQALDDEIETDAGSNADMADEDEKFLLSWRDDLLSQTWNSLADHETNSGVPYNTVLRIRVAEPTLTSDELAERISESLGKQVKSGAARVTVHRAREKFANLMIDVIANSLDSPTRESIESELIELRLIDYCRDALKSMD